MGTTVRLDDDLIAYIHEHGKFGESHSDVLRRRLIDFDDKDYSSISPINQPNAKSGRKPQQRLFGYSICSVIRWMRDDGWNEAEVRKVLDFYELEVSDTTIGCQLWEGREGAVAELTSEQAKELRVRK
jgi:hypothetical protein